MHAPRLPSPGQQTAVRGLLAGLILGNVEPMRHKLLFRACQLGCRCYHTFCETDLDVEWPTIRDTSRHSCKKRQTSVGIVEKLLQADKVAHVAQVRSHLPSIQAPPLLGDTQCCIPWVKLLATQRLQGLGMGRRAAATTSG